MKSKAEKKSKISMALDESDSSRKCVRTLEQFKVLLDRKYPKLMKDGISDTASQLPTGQLITLWMTLHHNYYEGCIQPLVEDELNDEQRLFFTTLSDYFCQFLSVVKMADPAIPTQTMEKMSNLNSKFGTDCLAGLAASLIDRKHDEDVVHWFLKLSFVWSELQGIMCHYDRSKYDGNAVEPVDPAATNLTYFLPYISSDEWQQLETQVQSFGDTCCKELFVRLVGQKLKYLTLFQQHTTNSDNSLLESSIREASKYIWSKLQERHPDSWHDELYSLASKNMPVSQIVPLVNGVVSHVSSAESCNIVSYPIDAKFHYALALELSGELLEKVTKMKILRKPFKQMRKQIFSSARREQLLSEFAFSDTPETIAILQEFLDLTNLLIDGMSGNTATSPDEQSLTQEFSEDLILPYVNLLLNLPLEQYPKTISTIVFLTTLNCVVALAQHSSENLLNLLVSILNQSSVNYVGNQFFFSVHWIQFFSWFSRNTENFSVSATRLISRIIFQNIYVSPKAVADFDEEFQALVKVKLTSPVAPIAQTLLEFLTNEMPNHSGKSKSKLGTQIQQQVKELMHATLKSLKKTQKMDPLKSLPKISTSNMFHASWILVDAFQTILSVKGSELASESLDISSLKSVLEFQADLAVDHLQGKDALDSKSKSKVNSEHDSNTKCEQSTRNALAFLRGFCKLKDLPAGFITKLWKAYILLPATVQDPTGFEIPVLMARDIYLAAGVEEFTEITKLMVNALESQSTLAHNEETNTKVGRLAVHLQELVDVELTPEKKTIRRARIESSLLALLSIFAQWDNSASSVTDVVLPFLQFLVKLLRRRNALCSTNALSLSLAAITAVPLNDITEIKFYRKVFCAVGDLLNSFTVHRIDVLSFRIHIYLQCFQYLVESITMRADQKRNIKDEEILDLKYCAHTMERICQSMKLGQKEFSRVSPYFIAILMRQFEVFTVYPAVKDSLLSGCYKLIDLCDDHGIAQLNSMFTAGSREIFKTVYDVYKKFYRYTGKV